METHETITYSLWTNTKDLLKRKIYYLIMYMYVTKTLIAFVPYDTARA